MISVRTVVGVVACTLVLGGCPPAAPPPDAPVTTPVVEPVDEQAARDALERIRTEYEDAYQARDLDRLANLFAENAVLSVPNAPPDEGRAAIRTRLQEGMEQVPESELAISSEETRVGERWAVDAGTATEQIDDREMRSSYMALVVRQADDTWHIQRLVISSDQPLPGAPEPTQ